MPGVGFFLRRRADPLKREGQALVSWDMDQTQAGLAAVTAASAEVKTKADAAMPATVAALTALIVTLPTVAGDPGTLWLNNGVVTVAD